jgi:hypothetical protein
MTTMTPGWQQIAGVECNVYDWPGTVVVRVCPVGSPKQCFRAMLRVARTVARTLGLGPVDPEAVAVVLRDAEDKLRLRFMRGAGGVLAD